MSEPYLINDPLIRAQSPVAGDMFTCDKGAAVVTSVGGGVVLVKLLVPGKKDRWKTVRLDDYPDVCKRTIEAPDCIFTAAKSKISKDASPKGSTL